MRWKARNPSPTEGIDWRDSDGICLAGGGDNEQESMTLLSLCTNSMTILNVTSTARSIKKQEVEEHRQLKLVLQQGQGKQNSVLRAKSTEHQG